MRKIITLAYIITRVGLSSMASIMSRIDAIATLTTQLIGPNFRKSNAIV